MNNENIAQLIVELDKLLPLVPAGNKFTSEWLENEYAGVTSMRAAGKPSYRNEYRIIKLLVEARISVLLRHRDKMMLFIAAYKKIEDSLKDIYNNRTAAKSVNAE